MSTIKVICKECKIEFEKLKHHYNYAEKMKRLHFCSKSCWSTFTQKNLSEEQKKKRYERIKGYPPYDATDAYSPFREYLKRTRDSQRHRKNSKFQDRPNLDLQYLKELWDSQNGICPYTGIKMEIGKNITGYHSIRSPKKASLDRIDSTKGYIKGNVEFVCMAINYAKNSFTREEIKKFIKEIQESNNI